MRLPILTIALVLAWPVSAGAHQLGQCESELRAYVDAMTLFTKLMDARPDSSNFPVYMEWRRERDQALFDLALVGEKYVICSIRTE